MLTAHLCSLGKRKWCLFRAWQQVFESWFSFFSQLQNMFVKTIQTKSASFLFMFTFIATLSIFLFLFGQQKDYIISHMPFKVEQEWNLKFDLNICDFSKNITSNRTKLYLQDFFSDEAIIQRTKNCNNYFSGLSPIGKPFSAFEPLKEEELAFPLAWAISAYHQIGILEMFLASSFRPNDPICVHVDAKSSDTSWTAAKQLIGCYQESTDWWLSSKSVLLLPFLSIGKLQ